MAKKSNGGAGRKSAAHLPPMKKDAYVTGHSTEDTKAAPKIGRIKRRLNRLAEAKAAG